MPARFISRREALALGLAAAGTLVRRTNAAGLVPAKEEAGAQPGPYEMQLVIRNARPLDAESPIEAQVAGSQSSKSIEAVLTEAPPVGTEVVIVGASNLYGTETEFEEE